MVRPYFPIRFITRVSPKSELHLGNSFSIVEQSIKHQGIEPCNNFCLISDFHTLTPKYNLEKTKKLSHTLATQLLSLGLSPERTIIFRESDVCDVMEVIYLVSLVDSSTLSVTERSMRHRRNIATGTYLCSLFNVADILGIRATHVFVGHDRLEDIESARRVASGFNRKVERDIFPLPESSGLDYPFVTGIDSLNLGYESIGPTREFDKNQNSLIPIFCSEEETEFYVSRLFISPLGDPIGPDMGTASILFNFLADDFDIKDIKTGLSEKNENNLDAIELLSQKINEFFSKARKTRRELDNRPDDVEDILQEGAAIARKEIDETLEEMRTALGMNNYRRFSRD